MTSVVAVYPVLITELTSNDHIHALACQSRWKVVSKCRACSRPHLWISFHHRQAYLNYVRRQNSSAIRKRFSRMVRACLIARIVILARVPRNISSICTADRGLQQGLITQLWTRYHTPFYVRCYRNLLSVCSGSSSCGTSTSAAADIVVVPSVVPTINDLAYMEQLSVWRQYSG